MKKIIILQFLTLFTLIFAQNSYYSSYEEVGEKYIETKVWADQKSIKAENIDGYIYVKNNNKYYVLKKYLDGEPINAKIFGVKADGIKDDTKSLQSAFTVCAKLGATLFLPSGVIITSSDININTVNTLSKKLKIVGSGIGNCIIRNTGTTTKYALHITGNYFDMLEMRDFRIERPDKGVPDGGTAIRIEKEFLTNIENIDIFRFTTGLELSDVNSTYMKSINVRWCGTGMKFKLATGGVSNPNLIELNNCVFNSSSKWGIELTYPHNVNFISCQFEANALGAINVLYDSVNGANSINVIGSYFEGNKGTDVYIKSLGSGTHNFVGNTFNRISKKDYSNNNIVLEVPQTNKNENILSMVGNGMLDANDYAADASRKAVKIIAPATTVKVIDTNSYKNNVDTPDYSNKNIQLIK